MANVVRASNVKVTAIKAGADNFFEGPGDDLYARITSGSDGGEFNHNIIKSNGQAAVEVGMFTGETAKVSTVSIFPFEGTPKITFELRDSDNRPPSSPGFFDTTVLKTSYTATGNEPLVGAGSLYFVNFSNMNGSQYKLEYNINKFSTTGKLASEKGGVLNGKNTDGTLLGQGGKDIIYANDGDDIVLGRGNNDTLYGGKGNDVVWGGKGYDRVSGGAGKDTFVVAQKTGLDTITDFRVGTDKIGLAYGLEYNDVSVWNKTGGTLLKAGSEKLAFLDGVNANQLGKSSFAYSDLASVNSLADANLANLAVG